MLLPLPLRIINSPTDSSLLGGRFSLNSTRKHTSERKCRGKQVEMYIWNSREMDEGRRGSDSYWQVKNSTITSLMCKGWSPSRAEASASLEMCTRHSVKCFSRTITCHSKTCRENRQKSLFSSPKSPFSPSTLQIYKLSLNLISNLSIFNPSIFNLSKIV